MWSSLIENSFAPALDIDIRVVKAAPLCFLMMSRHVDRGASTDFRKEGTPCLKYYISELREACDFLFGPDTLLT